MQKLRKVGARVLVCAALVSIGACGTENPGQLVASAKTYLAKHDEKAAIIQLKNALQIDPQLAEARFLLGKASLEVGDLPQAEKELRRAADLGYPKDAVTPLLAHVTLLVAGAEKVLDEFGKVELSSAESRASLQVTLGDAHLALGQIDAAKTAFDAASALQPELAPAILGQARVQAVKSDYPVALASVDRVLAKEPNNGAAWLLKGTILKAKGDKDEALAAYRKAVAADEKSLPARFVLASELLRRGALEDAKKEMTALDQLAREHPQTLYLHALIHYQEKNYPASREFVQRALQRAPDNPGLLALSAGLDLEAKAYASAENSLVRALGVAPDNLTLRRMLAGTYLRSGQPRKALEALKPVESRMDTDSDLLATAGQVYLANGLQKEATQAFGKAASLDPSSGKRAALAVSEIASGDSTHGLQELQSIAAKSNDDRADLALIAVNMQRGDVDSALSAVAELKKKKQDASTSTVEGNALLAKKDVGAARHSYEDALRQDPAYLPAAMRLAGLDIAAKDPASASKRFEGVLAKDPNNVEALLALAEVRARSGAPRAEVLALINKAIAAKPTDPNARAALVNYHLALREPQQALAAAQEAITAAPGQPGLLELLGLAQAASGQREQALDTFGKLAQQIPESPLPWWRMAALNQQAGDTASATRNLEKAVALKPDFVQAQTALAGLYARAGRTQDALAIARNIQKQRPKQGIGYALEGDIYTTTKQWNEAARAYRAAIQQGEMGATTRLHAALVAGGKQREADNFAVTWLNDHPTDNAFREYLGEQAIMKSDYKGAYNQYEALLRNGTQSVAVLNNLALVAGKLKDPKALTYAERAYSMAPNEPAVMDTYGTLLIDQGETARGMQMLQKATEAAPKNAMLRLNLAKAYLKTGDKPSAKRELDTLAKLGDQFPDQATVAQLLKGL